MTNSPRWKIVVENLQKCRAIGNLGVVAASTNIPEYKLHDVAKGLATTLSNNEIQKLCEHFEGK